MTLLNSPQQQVITVSITPNMELEFGFDPGSEAQLSRDGDNLIFTFEDGGQIILSGFYAQNIEELPILNIQGTEVSAGDFLASLGDESLLPAAGPAAPQAPTPPDSSGGTYDDDAGSLIGGVDSFGMLGRNFWDRTSESPIEGVSPGITGAGAEGTDGTDGSGTPDDPVAPLGPLDYIARGIMYTQNENTLPELSVDLLSVSGGSATKYAAGSAPADASLSFFDESGNAIPDPMGWHYDQASGKIIFDNPPAAGGIFYVTITDSNGKTYSMQIVVTPDEAFDSTAQDAATPPAGGELAHGEWHSGKDTDNSSGYGTTSSNLDDEMTFNGDIVGGKINTGYGDPAKNNGRAWGDDSVTVHGNVDKTDMDFGTGAGMLDIKNSLRAFDGDSTITMAHGAIDINADQTGGRYGIYTAGNGRAVTINGGDATVTIGAGTDKATGSTAYGVFAGKGGDVTVNAGGVDIDAAGIEALGIYADGGSIVDITADDVTLNAKGETASSWTRGMQASGQNSAINIHAAGEVSVSAYGNQGYAMSAEGLNNSTRIQGAEKVTLKASHTGMNASSGNANNTIDGGEVRIIVDGSTPNAYHNGMYASEAKNTIRDASSVTIEALKGGTASVGVNSAYKGENTITSTGDVIITAKDGTSANHGLSANNGSNSITSTNGGVKISATGGTGNTYGVYANQSGSDSITAAGDVIIAATGGKAGRGLYATEKSTVDVTAENVTITTNGASNSVGMHANKSEITVHSKGGTVDITAIGLQGNNGYGMMGENKGAALIDGAQTVNIRVNQDGMCALSGGSNTIKGSGATGAEVNIYSKGSGMYANSGNASNTITGMESIHLGDANNRSLDGMNAYTATNRIEGAKSAEIYAKGNAMTAGAGANTTAGNTIQAESVTLDAAGASVSRGMNVSDNGAANTITAGDVTIKASGAISSYGMAAGQKGENTINTDSVNITASNTAYAYGMQAATEGKNTINADSSVEITAAGASEGRGMAAGGQIKGVTDYNHFQGSNTINADAGADVTIKASGSASSTGMHAVNKGTNTITADGGAVSVTARGGESYGMYTQGGDNTNAPDQSKNLIQGAAKVAVTADKIGMGANRGHNAITDIHDAAGEKAVEIIADGASIDARSGMYAANHWSNTINTVSENRIDTITGDVAVTASGSGGANVAMNAYTVKQASGAGNAKNIITGVDGDVTISALGGDQNYAMHALATSGSNPTANIIDGVSGTVTLKASGGAESFGMSASGGNAANTINNAANVDILAESGANAYALHASGQGARNVISVGEGPIAVVITATGKDAAHSFAMFAENGGVNQITGKSAKGGLGDHIELNGRIHADASSQNSVKTGQGDDRIKLNGKIDGDFQLIAGDAGVADYDILVLRASSWDEFETNYRTWLENALKNGDSMHIESIHWIVDNGLGMPAGHWLEKLINDWNNDPAHADNQISFSQEHESTLDNILQTDENGHAVSNHVDHNGDMNADVAFGGGDDHLHATGHADSIAIDLGQGHNTLIIDGHADNTSIHGGDHGNDITLHSASDSSIDLGDGRDVVAVGHLDGGFLNLGAGDDILHVSKITNSSVINGGGGMDELHLDTGGQGDIRLDQLFDLSQASNFEKVVVNLNGGGQDTLNLHGDDLNSLLNAGRDSDLLGPNGKASVFINGDTASGQEDSIRFTGSGWDQQNTDTTTHGGYIGYTHHDDSTNTDQIVYVQQSLLVTFGG